MPTSEKEKPKPPDKAHELFYREHGLRADEALHDPIIEDGDHARAEAVSRKVSKRLGLSDQQVDRLLGRKPAK
jgi:hypothetical protein